MLPLARRRASHTRPCASLSMSSTVGISSGGMNVDLLAEGSTLPLVVTPRAPAERDVGALVAWLRGEQASFAARLTRHGAVLLRGFDLDGPRDFERAARAISPVLQNDYLGTSPRDALTEYVFSASELPPYYPIPQHCEMSF